MSDQRRDELENIILKHEREYGQCQAESSILVSNVIDWMNRWSGRPSRRVILECIHRFSDHVLGGKAQGYMADDILALYPSPVPERPKVTRRDIAKTLSNHVAWFTVDGNPENAARPSLELLDDLCALIGVEECNHKFYYTRASVVGSDSLFELADLSKGCPVCKKE